MTSKVDETISKIPSLQVNIGDIFDFKDKCFDKLAVEIIAESLTYALETSVRRLESVGKVNPAIRDNATETILPAVKTLRDLIEKAHTCKVSALGAAPVKPPDEKAKFTTKKADTKKADTKKTKEKAKTSEGLVQNLTNAVTEAKTEAGTAQTESKTEAQTEAKPTAEQMAAAFTAAQEMASKASEADIKKAIKTVKSNVVVGPGRQFEFEGKRYLVVAKMAMKNDKQVPREEGVIKLSEDSPLAKLATGKKSGDFIKILDDKGEYEFPIKDVRDGGAMKMLGPDGKEIKMDDKE